MQDNKVFVMFPSSVIAILRTDWPSVERLPMSAFESASNLPLLAGFCRPLVGLTKKRTLSVRWSLDYYSVGGSATFAAAGAIAALAAVSEPCKCLTSTSSAVTAGQVARSISANAISPRASQAERPEPP